MIRGPAALALGFALVALTTFVAVSVGSTGMGWGDGGALALLRAPRAAAAACAGLALGVAGALQQGVFRNPLADPGLTGVFGGALLGAALLLGFAPEAAWSEAWRLPAAGFVGATLASAALATFGGGGGSARLLLAGLGVNAFTAAATLIVASVRPGARETIANGAYGDWLGTATPETVWLPALACVAASLAALRLAGGLDRLSLGDDVAVTLGCDPRGLRIRSALLTSVAAGAATCLVGQVAFLGLIAPHLARALVGPSHRMLIPLSGLMGAALLTAADTVGRSAFTSGTLPAAAVMAALGAPAFVWIARKSHD
ncbi:MAG: FecCD family ABC transporter permease [Verrucomicrobiota bacterium]